VALDVLPVAQYLGQGEVLPDFVEPGLAHEVALPLRPDPRVWMLKALTELGSRHLDIPEKVRPVEGQHAASGYRDLA
jgi:hypothetical protein